ncbi:MAG: prenyltransferase/squalene oxidase repeat-containing protein, partial [Planctomycetaceae bacterium]
LSIMAFMAAGHVPGEGPYGEQLLTGIRWVLDHQRANGMFMFSAGHGPMYAHGICTLMLAEAAGMADQPIAGRIRTSLEKAIRLILKAQSISKGVPHTGGWRYQSTSNDSDLSVTGWQLLALRAAKNIGCDVPKTSIDAAVAYVRRCAASRGFGYQPGHGVTATRTGTGILCLEICGKHHARETMNGAESLLRKPLGRSDGFFFYGVYYCSVGMFQVGEQYWTRTRDHITSMLLSMQHGDGRWQSAAGNESSYGATYATSLAVLALAVEYQYLPIYQR